MNDAIIMELLKQKFTDDNPALISFRIQEGSFTESHIRYLNYLTGLKRPDINLYIWNKLINPRIDEDFFKEMDKSVLTKESLDLLSNYIETIDCLEHTNVVNYHNCFQTDRLIITTGDEMDALAYYNQLRKCGKSNVDYLLTKITPKDKELHTRSIYSLGTRYEPLGEEIFIGFVIKSKINNEMIGYVQFYQKESYTPEIGYYIFENFRKKGFAFEALNCLLKNLFQHGFKYPAVAKYNYVIKEKIVKPSIVRASVNARNMASVNLLKKVGFSYSGTIYQQRIDPYTKEKLDVNQYYIEAKDYIHK